MAEIVQRIMSRILYSSNLLIAPGRLPGADEARTRQKVLVGEVVYGLACEVLDLEDEAVCL